MRIVERIVEIYKQILVLHIHIAAKVDIILYLSAHFILKNA